MSTLVLKHANKNRLGAIDWGPNDFDVLDTDRCIGRIFLSPALHLIGMDVDDHCTRASANDPQSRLFSNSRASDERF
jgi:hypothetical protein